MIMHGNCDSWRNVSWRVPEVTLIIYYIVLQAVIKLIQDAQQGAYREDMSYCPVKVIVGKIRHIEEEVLENEVQEQTIN